MSVPLLKTIFVTVFEGIEGKNLLRTSVVATLLKDSTVRVVLLVKSEDRKKYYQKEFGHRQLFCEVVSDHAPSPLDMFFAALRYYLIDTETTRFRAKLLMESGGNIFSYWLRICTHRLLARKKVRTIARKLDLFLVKDSTYSDLFDRYSPDLVLCAQAFDESETHLLREAKMRGVRTVVYINTWDKVTARSAFRILADKFVVFNTIVRDELVVTNDVRVSDIFVSGIPQYDQYFDETVLQRVAGSFDTQIAPPVDKSTFLQLVGLTPDTRFVLYAPMGSEYSNQDWRVIDMLHRHITEKRYGERVELFVRFPPNDFLKNNEIEKRPWLRWQYPAVRFSNKRGGDWDMSFEDLKLLTDTLTHASLIVCYASSFSIDGCVFDVPVINLNFELQNEVCKLKSPTKFYHFAHYKKAVAVGAIKLVSNEDALIDAAVGYLAHPESEREERRLLVEQQCAYTDGKSGERIANFLLSNLV